LAVGAALPLQAMNIVALVLMHSSSLRQALAHTVRLQHLVSNSGRFATPAGARGSLHLDYCVSPSPAWPRPARPPSRR
jgi:hypothetical protein